ncbi:uncharacterized protein [Montipora foliosa]|uniref:uncharacterized protein n=1 Tax=Montipora foliosa TaxID=591990 RepID=UPI0035F1F0C1
MASRTNLSKIFLFLAMASFATLTESIQRCKHYPDPKHGHMVCDSLFRLFCTPECDDGFVFKFKPAVVYMCGPMTGKWFTYPEGENIPWPNCIKRQSTDDPAEDEAASRRAQISQKIHDTHSLMLSEKNNQQQMEKIGQLDARYLHLFNYLQRAMQAYDRRRVESGGRSGATGTV